LEIFLTNNDILRRIRYTFNFNDKQMVAIFALAEHSVTREQVCNWLKKEDDSDYVNCTDMQLAAFLNGFINEKRGKRNGEQPTPEKKLTNNIILTKLKIAFALKAEDIIDLLKSVDLRIGKAELSAFFRKADHKHYRQCKDQILRNFLQAIQDKYYVERSKKIDFNAHKKIDNSITNQDDGAIKKTQTWHANTTKNNIPKDKTTKVKKEPASKSKTLYVNPNAKVSEQQDKNQTKSTRKVLKLKPEDIWKS
jgi:uncharacterized protein YehS (DUF1456 family)